MMFTARKRNFSFLTILLVSVAGNSGCIDSDTDHEVGGGNGGNDNFGDVDNGDFQDESTWWINGSRTKHVIFYHADTGQQSAGHTGNPVTRESGSNCITLDPNEISHVYSGIFTASWEAEDDVREIPELIFAWDNRDEQAQVQGPSPLTLEMTSIDNENDILIKVRETEEYSAINNLTVEFGWSIQYQGTQNATVYNAGCG